MAQHGTPQVMAKPGDLHEIEHRHSHRHAAANDLTTAERWPPQLNATPLSPLPPYSEDAEPSFRHNFMAGHGDRAQTVPVYSTRRGPSLQLDSDWASRDTTPIPGSPGPDKFQQQPSRSHITDRTFLEWFNPGVVTLSYLSDQGETKSLYGLNEDLLTGRCPLLKHVLEDSRTGPLLFLDALKDTTALPFVRFLYTGTYALVDAQDTDIHEAVPTSLLLHCQVFELGTILGLPELRAQANVNIMRQCEFGCSSPDKPIDLCRAIEYAYANLGQHKSLIETIVNYCVSCFLQHRLSDDVHFSQLAYGLQSFHKDLCRISMERGFENETAIAIIRMPFKPYNPPTYASREDIDLSRLRDGKRIHTGETHWRAVSYHKGKAPAGAYARREVPIISNCSPSSGLLQQQLQELLHPKTISNVEPPQYQTAAANTQLWNSEAEQKSNSVNFGMSDAEAGAEAEASTISSAVMGANATPLAFPLRSRPLVREPAPSAIAKDYPELGSGETSDFELVPRIADVEALSSSASSRMSRDGEDSEDDTRYSPSAITKEVVAGALTRDIAIRQKPDTRARLTGVHTSASVRSDEESEASDWSLV